jgi:hypothetical protein
MRKWKIGVGFAAAAAVTVVAVRPGTLLRVFPRYSPVVHHLQGRRLDSGDPIYFHIGYRRPARVETAAIRRAGTLVPNGGVYYVRGPASDPTTTDVMQAAQLFFMPAVQSRTPRAASWVLSYRSRAPKPPLPHVYELSRDLRLIRVR